MYKNEWKQGNLFYVQFNSIVRLLLKRRSSVASAIPLQLWGHQLRPKPHKAWCTTSTLQWLALWESQYKRRRYNTLHTSTHLSLNLFDHFEHWSINQLPHPGWNNNCYLCFCVHFSLQFLTCHTILFYTLSYGTVWKLFPLFLLNSKI